MAKFFINRPIVAMVFSILLVLVGLVSMSSLPVAQFPNIADPQIQVNATYPGADALTVQQSVAVPIEQQMSGVDNMEYMYSLNANNGTMKLTIDFDVATDPNTDQILSQMRQGQANSQLPTAVVNQGVTVQKSTAAPLIMFALVSPKNTYDSIFLANYSYININDAMTRVKGIASVSVFGAAQYAIRLWVRPDRLAQMGITVPEIMDALQQQNTVNPAGTIGGEPIPKGQEFTRAVRTQGRLETAEQFGEIVLRAGPGGATVRVKDIARVELAAQNYDRMARLNGKPCALIALYQLPNSNAVEAADGVKRLMETLKRGFPPDLDYVIALDTTRAVTEGIKEIRQTLFEALALVIVVVFIFLQGWRATLIPLLAVPVSLVGTFALFPLLGFSINTLSLFGLVLAIGLVVDDAIIVVEIVEHHIEYGLSPKEAALKGMQEVTGPVIATAVILTAVFLPTAFIPGITGRLYQQFAVTIAVSVLISAFNALTLSPALAGLLLRPRKHTGGPLQKLFDGFNKGFGRATDGYVGVCRFLVHKSAFAMVLLAGAMALAGVLGKSIATSFLPDEDQGYAYAGLQLPDTASLQRTDEVVKKAEEILKHTPGVKYYSAVVGFSMLSGVMNTYSGFFFISFEEWALRPKPEEKYQAIMAHLNRELAKIPGAVGFAFAPPAIPGVGTSGGVTFVLEDRSGKGVEFLADNLAKYLDAVRKRPELSSVFSTALLQVPQVYVDVDRDQVLSEGVKLQDVYQTMQCFMGGAFVNYFNRFGRQWQVYIQSEGDYRTEAENLGEFYVLNNSGDMVPLSALTRVREAVGPEFTMRYNLFQSAQINASAKPGYSSAQAMKAMEEVFEQTMPPGMGYDYLGMSFQEKKAQEGVSSMVIFGFSLVCVFLILAAQYESWYLPFSVLLGTPIAVFGAFTGLIIGRYENNVYAQIGLVMLIGLAAKNAILIVEFAKTRCEEGKPLVDATLEGARLRLRPILMTSFAFILGCVPLATASGAGALARQVMGFTVIGGMAAASCIAIFLIPACFYVVQKLSARKREPAPAAMPPPAETIPTGGGTR
jgi:hydrophobic/amphiphilic exporter-1 (mainly G- bacteria), HAE1 family